MRVDLGLDALAPIGRLREQVERPGQRIRGGLVARANEGDDVGAHVLQAHAAPGLGIERTQQQRQQIGGRGGAGVDQPPAARK